MLASEILGLLPPPDFKSVLIRENQGVNDIIKEVMGSHKRYLSHYCRIAKEFDRGKVKETAYKLFDFLKNNISYEIESEDLQTVKSPARYLHDGVGDCKHFANFAAGIFSCLGYDWKFCFASYNPFDKTPTHVFVIVKDENGKEIWFDPVLSFLDQRYPIPIFKKMISFEKNKKTMALKRVSGLPTVGEANADLWKTISDTANGIINSIFGGKVQSNQYGCNCPGKDSVNVGALLIAAGVGVGAALLITKKKRKRK